MKIGSINSVSSTTNQNVTFKNTAVKQLEENKKAKEDKTMMIVAGLTAAAALAVAGIIITRGRKSKLNTQKPIDIPTTPDGSINKPDEVVNTIIEKEKEREKAIEFLKEIKEKEIKAEEEARAAQDKYNKPFDDALSGKSAKDSANNIIEIEKEKAIELLKRRKEIELEVEKKAQAAQEKYNKPFDDALSNKSAEESAEVMIREDYNIRAELSGDCEYEGYGNLGVLNTKEFIEDFCNCRYNGIPFNPAQYGFSPVGQLVTFADGTSACVHSGSGLLDVTSDGRLLIKQYADWYLALLNGEKPRYNDISKDFLNEEVNRGILSDLNLSLPERNTIVDSHYDNNYHMARARAYA